MKITITTITIMLAFGYSMQIPLTACRIVDRIVNKQSRIVAAINSPFVKAPPVFPAGLVVAVRVT